MSGFADPAIAAKRYPHGTPARYSLGLCRCFACRVANTERQNARMLALRGPWRSDGRGALRKDGLRTITVRNVVTGAIDCRTTSVDHAKRRVRFLNKRDAERPGFELIDARPALQYIDKLRAQGVGLKTIALRSGIARSHLQELVQRTKGSRIRRDTADAILGVLPIAKGTTKIDGAATWVLLDDLLARGFSKNFISRELGGNGLALQIHRDHVTAKTAQKVSELHERLKGQVPPPRRNRWSNRAPAAPVAPSAPVTPKAPPAPIAAKANKSKHDPTLARRWDELFREAFGGAR